MPESGRVSKLQGSEVDDAELVAHALGGDIEAFGQLYERHAPSLRPWARRWSTDPSSGEDLLHDVFVEAWAALDRFRPARGSFRVWMLTRLRSRSLDRARRRDLERRFGELEASSASGSITVEEPAGDFQLRAWLVGLPESMQRTLKLVYFDGCSAAEAAAVLGEPVGTVKSRLARALQRLREASMRGSRER